MRSILAVLALLCAAQVAAQSSYPEKPVRILVGNSPAEFAAPIKAEIPQWAKVVKAAGIKPPD